MKKRLSNFMTLCILLTLTIGINSGGAADVGTVEGKLPPLPPMAQKMIGQVPALLP